MSQALLAPSAVVLPATGRQVVLSGAGDAGLPFARQQAATPGGWIAGLAFGLVCLGAGVVMVVACLVLAVVLAVAGLLRRSDRIGDRSRPSQKKPRDRG